LIIDGKMYKGTEGLWELLTRKNPQNYTQNDEDVYYDILIASDAVFQNNDPKTKKPKSSRSEKYNKIIKFLWEEHYYPRFEKAKEVWYRN